MISSQVLSVGYVQKGKEQVLFENLNLQLVPGKLICFMGANGVGKSTLLRTLAGLQTPLGGKVIGDKKDVAIVLTDRVASLNMTVFDLVTYGRYPYLNWRLSLSEENKNIIQEAIQRVHLESIQNKKLSELSDGQMQLAMVARAVAQQTPVMMLDEPTAHLDLNNRVEIMNLLRSLARKMNKAILVTTHELDLALQTADMIWLATSDKKIKTGIPEDLVLDGSFDDIFQLKGFDLKTGKMDHEAYQGKSVQLNGDGYPYLWTKNALNRNGYNVIDNAPFVIEITTNSKTNWSLNANSFETIAELLDHLSSH